MQLEIQIPNPKDKKIKRLFGEFVQAPTYKGLERVMRRANRVIAGTVPPTIGGSDPALCNTEHSWLKSQFAVWKSVSAATPREEIIYNFKDIVYHLKSISYLSQRGLLSYSAEERRMYSDVLQYYAGILGHAFLVSADRIVAPVAPATNDKSAPVAPATNDKSAPVAPAPSAPIPIPLRVQRKPLFVNVDVDTYSPEYAVGDGCTGRSSGFGGQSEWDIG